MGGCGVWCGRTGSGKKGVLVLAPVEFVDWGGPHAGHGNWLKLIGFNRVGAHDGDDFNHLYLD